MWLWSLPNCMQRDKMLMNLNIETHGTIAFVSTVLSSIELKMVSNYYFFMLGLM